MKNPRARIALSVLALFFLVLGIAALVLDRPASTAPTPQEAPRPAPSAAVLTQLATSPAFQYLVSYSATGFSPASLSVKPGETVRFTNNSGENLWIVSSSTPIYPAVGNGCGSSALDSCQAIPPGGFWEFTFSASGTWRYINTLKQTDSAAVVVE